VIPLPNHSFRAGLAICIDQTEQRTSFGPRKRSSTGQSSFKADLDGAAVHRSAEKGEDGKTLE
jgi:hypothetical protein